MRLASIVILVLTTSASLSQGQESLPVSTVHDSVRLGSVIYRAATTLTYPRHQPKDDSDVKGDLATVVTITNAGTTPASISLAKCAQTVRAFLDPDYRNNQRFSGWFPDTAPCFNKQIDVSLGAGESRQLVALTRNWKHGQFRILGPLHFVDILQLRDTVLRLRAGATKFASDLAGLDYHAATSLEGVAPSKVATTVTISNRGELPVRLEYGECALDLLAFTSPAKTGKPAWVSNPSGMCILPLYTSHVAPGHRMTRVVAVPTHDMLRDPIPAGRYFFTAELKLNNKKLVMDAGTLTLRGSEDPLPVSRSVDSIQFSGSVKRSVQSAGIPDSLEVMLIARNTSHTIRLLRPEGRCVGVLGYKTRERRDSYYSRPAYENDWILRGCQMPIIAFELAPGGVRAFFKRMPAPAESMYYALATSFYDDAFPTREPYFVDVAADESVREKQ